MGKTLNTAQQNAVDAIDGPLMVLAGPGTGKTQLLSMRVAEILKKTDVLPQNILCLTFTEAGAAAMQQRLIDTIGQAGYKVPVHTFHGFAADIASRYRQYFHGGADIAIADNLQRWQIISTILDSLQYDNPLKISFDGEYTSIRDIQAAISEIKRSGLTLSEFRAVLDSCEEAIEAAEPLLRDAIGAKITRSTLDVLAQAARDINALQEPQPQATIPRLSHVIAESLEHAVAAATDHAKVTPPLTSWKNQWLTKDSDGQFVLKSHARVVKLRALLPVIEAYQQAMTSARLQDFDDLILMLIHTLETQPDLRYELQEHYQYIMVDEFQDTNLAQMRILNNLTNSPVNEGQPNIMVVGDDDQAIFSFQGAEVGNILTFISTYPDAGRIVLTENYRSPEVVLEAARAVIGQGSERLEATIPGLVKQLNAHHTPAAPSAKLVQFASTSSERTWVAERVAALIASGVPAHDIAIIGKQHDDLESMVPYLNHHKLPLSYEKRENVLDNESVKQLTLLAEIIYHLHHSRFGQANELLPELLAHPAWNISVDTLWQLGLASYRDKKLWFELFETFPETTPLAPWFKETVALATTLPLEHMLDRLMGANETDDTFSSPLKQYFFDEGHVTDSALRYVDHLESLRAVREKLRAHFANDATVTLDHFIEFIHLHRKTHSNITRIRTVGDSAHAVNLLTAHGSKGLEFEHVYIVGAIDSRWGDGARAKSSIINYPENLRLRAQTNSFDERLRLFFVAMTRAKACLTVSYADTSDAGKSQLLASFLADNQHLTAESVEPDRSVAAALHTAQTMWYERLIDAPGTDLLTALKPQLDFYKLSATDLCSFLDVTKGGPHNFLLNNLLHFPSAMSPAASYGSAVHAVIQHAHSHIAAGGQPLPEEDLLGLFEQELRKYPLEATDFAHYLKRGSDSLTAFFRAQYASFTANQTAELNFAGQNVVLGDAKLKGKLDLVTIDAGAKTIAITDYKTGSAFSDWGKGSAYDKSKSHHYRQQLQFYQLLVANSRDYSHLEVASSNVQFVEPDKAGIIRSVALQPSSDELARLTDLIQIVWQKITAGDFPETNQYSTDVAGITAFEQDLLDSKI